MSKETDIMQAEENGASIEMRQKPGSLPLGSPASRWASKPKFLSYNWKDCEYRIAPGMNLTRKQIQEAADNGAAIEFRNASNPWTPRPPALRALYMDWDTCEYRIATPEPLPNYKDLKQVREQILKSQFIDFGTKLPGDLPNRDKMAQSMVHYVKKGQLPKTWAGDENDGVDLMGVPTYDKEMAENQAAEFKADDVWHLNLFNPRFLDECQWGGIADRIAGTVRPEATFPDWSPTRRRPVYAWIVDPVDRPAVAAWSRRYDYVTYEELTDWCDTYRWIAVARSMCQ